MIEPAPALRLKDVHKNYGALCATRNVSLEVKPGERRALIGPNGAGKTTLFQLISGMVDVTSGSIELFGRDVTHLPCHGRVALGMARTFQITNLFQELSVLENVILALQSLDSTRFSMLQPLATFKTVLRKAHALLDDWQLDLRANTLVKNLSYGEQRSLEILLGVAQQPKLLLLDEPTAGLSPAETVSAAELIEKLPRDTAILLIEHDMDVALKLCDTLTVMHLGEVLATGPKEEVRRNPQVQAIYLGSGSSCDAAAGHLG